MNMVNRFEQLLLPGTCLLCGAYSQRAVDICRACELELPALGPHCQACALPLATSADHCGNCLRKAPHFTRTHAGWRYQAQVAQLISQFKYHRQHAFGRVLAELLAAQLQAAYALQAFPELLIPTPMHWWRRLRRGFNQSEQLAQQLSLQLQIPLFAHIRRVRHSKAQRTLTAAERQRNLRSAFRVTKALAGQRVALVDDVMTTGATANEISRLLLAAGAAEVHIWCLARTPIDRTPLSSRPVGKSTPE
jgi:ComF family protein